MIQKRTGNEGLDTCYQELESSVEMRIASIVLVCDDSKLNQQTVLNLKTLPHAHVFTTRMFDGTFYDPEDFAHNLRDAVEAYIQLPDATVIKKNMQIVLPKDARYNAVLLAIRWHLNDKLLVLKELEQADSSFNSDLFNIVSSIVGAELDLQAKFALAMTTWV